MSELRAEAISLIDEVPTDKLGKLIDVLKNFIHDEDPFWSEENQAELKRRIDDMNHGRNIVTFTDEEWEKFVNAQDLS